MNRYASPSRSCRSSSRFTTPAWIDTSSAETGSSSTSERRVEREGASDADALALTARELVRVAVRVMAVQPDERQQLFDTRPVIAGHLVDDERLRDRGADRHAGIERRVRILEHDLHLASQPAQLALVDGGELGAAELHRARGRHDQLQHAPPDGRLARAGLADEAERLPGADRERHIRHGLHRALHRARALGAAHVEVLHEMLDAEDRRVCGALGCGRLLDDRAHRPKSQWPMSCSLKWHAAS